MAVGSPFPFSSLSLHHFELWLIRWSLLKGKVSSKVGCSFALLIIKWLRLGTYWPVGVYSYLMLNKPDEKESWKKKTKNLESRSLKASSLKASSFRDYEA